MMVLPCLMALLLFAIILNRARRSSVVVRIERMCHQPYLHGSKFL